MNKDLHNVFDFVVADDDVMLLIYKSEGEPKSPMFEIDAAEKTLWLYRNQNSSINLNIQNVESDIIFKLSALNKLLVCEMNFPEDAETSEVEYIYEAQLLK